MTTWIDRRETPPPTSDRILVWSEEEGFPGVIACKFDYSEWLDAVDGVGINFTFWQPAPPPPNGQDSKDA